MDMRRVALANLVLVRVRGGNRGNRLRYAYDGRTPQACVQSACSHELIPDWVAAPRIFSARGTGGGGSLAQEPLILTPYC